MVIKTNLIFKLFIKLVQSKENFFLRYDYIYNGPAT